MPSLTRVFQLLPVGVLVWLAIGASRIFRPDVGRRDPRGLGIAATLWGTIGVMQLGPVAAEYALYTSRTGRLFPRWR